MTSNWENRSLIVQIAETLTSLMSIMMSISEEEDSVLECKGYIKEVFSVISEVE